MIEKKPKEYWISNNGNNGLCYVDDEKYVGYDIHVIEKRAYDKAVELLRYFTMFDNSRGYPRGSEWIALIKKIKDSGVLDECELFRHVIKRMRYQIL